MSNSTRWKFYASCTLPILLRVSFLNTFLMSSRLHSSASFLHLLGRITTSRLLSPQIGLFEWYAGDRSFKSEGLPRSQRKDAISAFPKSIKLQKKTFIWRRICIGEQIKMSGQGKRTRWNISIWDSCRAERTKPSFKIFVYALQRTKH